MVFKKMNKFNEICYWNHLSYGSSIKISRFTIKSLLIGLGFVVPVIIPVPLMMFISRFVKKDIVYRY